MDHPSSPISVVIPTYRRVEQLSGTLTRILECNPPPAEVVVHVDAGDEDTGTMLGKRFPHVRVLTSQGRMGPGGGRNKAIAAASHETIVSFDDDSFPVDGDYFTRVRTVLDLLPDAAVVASQVAERGQSFQDARTEFGPTVNFSGGGVAYRREAFLASGGYVPLAVAYGMEEVDLCLRLVAQGRKIYFTPWLRVFHDNDLSHHAEAHVTAASIANLALLVFLRYPFRFWPYGAMQLVNRVVWLVQAGRMAGVMSGLAGIAGHVWRHRQLRAPVSASALSAFLKARRIIPRLEPLEP